MSLTPLPGYRLLKRYEPDPEPTQPKKLGSRPRSAMLTTAQKDRTESDNDLESAAHYLSVIALDVIFHIRPLDRLNQREFQPAARRSITALSRTTQPAAPVKIKQVRYNQGPVTYPGGQIMNPEAARHTVFIQGQVSAGSNSFTFIGVVQETASGKSWQLHTFRMF